MNEKERTIAFLTGAPYDQPPKNPDVISFAPASDRLLSVDLPVCERPMTCTGYDAFGVHWTKAIEGCHRTPGQKPILRNIEQWEEQVSIPKAERFDWSYVSRQVEHVNREKTIIRATLTMGPFERFSVLCPFEEALVYTLTDPEACYDLLGRLADFKIDCIRALGRYAQPDVVIVHDDWGTVRAPFLSMDSWRTLIRPHTQRIYHAIKEIGAVAVQHSCGNITPIIGDLVEMGLDAWQGQGYCNDVELLKKQFGDQLYMVFTYLENASEKRPAPVFPADMLSNVTYEEVPVFLY